MNDSSNRFFAVNQSPKGLVVFGDDHALKKQRLDIVRQGFFAGAGSVGGQDSVQIYPDSVDLRALEDILTMVSFQGKRMIVFKSAEGLKAPVKEYLTAFITKRLTLFDVFLVFDYEDTFSDSTRDTFIGLLKSTFPVQRCQATQSSSEITFSQLFTALRSRKRSAVLRVTEALLREKEEEVAPQIMGVLVSYVQNSAFPGKDRMLYQLWKTDRTIKTGAGSPRTVISLCLIKLFRDYLK